MSRNTTRSAGMVRVISSGGSELTLGNDEKETLLWIWDDLIHWRLIMPTGKDLVIPDNWVRITDKGAAAIEGKSYVEYDEHQVFIPKGEVYTAYRTIKTS